MLGLTRTTTYCICDMRGSHREAAVSRIGDLSRAEDLQARIHEQSLRVTRSEFSGDDAVLEDARELAGR
jgi:hypothetical protein